MKLVINKCFGGFSLSHDAVMLYAKLSGFNLYAFVDADKPDGSLDFGHFEPYHGGDPFTIHYSKSPLNKNREFMKQASAEMGRNARNMARAVDYFKPFFTGEHTAVYIADDYLRLFAYAQLNRETAMELFKINKFDYPLYVIRERVAAAKPKRERKATPIQQVGDIVRRAVGFARSGKSDSLEPGIEWLASELCNIEEINKAVNNETA